MSRERAAIALIVAQAVAFSIDSIAVHRIGTQLGVMQVACLRSLGGLLLVGALAGGVGWSVFRTGWWWLQGLRAAASIGYLWIFVYSFSRVPLVDATAISYTQALYLTLFSALILGERVTAARWAASAVGVIGVMLIVKPGFGSANVAYLIAVAGTSLNAMALILTKVAERRDTALTVMLYANAAAALCNAPSLASMPWPAWDLLPSIVAVMIFGPVGMYCGMVAVRMADVSLLAPYTYVRLVVVAAAGALLFGEAPDAWSLVGTSAIIAACILAASTGPRQTAREVATMARSSGTS
jgi:drug/metabolite transporter (DMT)-like permease